MKKFVLLLVTCAFLSIGCSGTSIFVPLGPDIDSIYEGYVKIYDPGKGFDHSFYGELRIWNNGHSASMIDDHGRRYDADHVEYDSWLDELEVYFKIRQDEWTYDCGHEVYDWEVRLIGTLRNRVYAGDVQADIDPEDYYSDNCYLDYNPPPEYVGNFTLDRLHYGW